MSLAVSIFILVFITELISWVGKTFLSDLAFGVYQRVFNSKKISEQNQLKKDILTAKTELLQTSSQDQFAKWAKLRRKVDKGMVDLERINSELGATRGSFSMKFGTVLWLSTSGVQFAIGWWYGKSAVFYLPQRWFGPLTWWMSFPFAPYGSVSCGVWQMACRRVLKVGERVMKDLMDK